ncbi:hypothetical protein KAU13_06150, partial [candidate division WOR-3 bacterium]|nr:hypothetical protein [candidate division WOR-3 bacterium]
RLETESSETVTNNLKRQPIKNMVGCLALVIQLLTKSVFLPLNYDLNTEHIFFYYHSRVKFIID